MARRDVGHVMPRIPDKNQTITWQVYKMPDGDPTINIYGSGHHHDGGAGDPVGRGVSDGGALVRDRPIDSISTSSRVRFSRQGSACPSNINAIGRGPGA